MPRNRPLKPAKPLLNPNSDMKRFCLSLIVLFSGLSMAWSQIGPTRGAGISTPKKKELNEAVERLRQARQTMDVEQAKETAKGVLQKLPEGVTQQVTGAAKEAMQSKESRDQAVDALKSAASSFAPDAQKAVGGLIPKTTPAKQEEAPPSNGPKPGALQPLVESAPPAAGKPITIDSDSAVFDLKAGIFIYTGHVRAMHPQFYTECEELEVHMHKEEGDKTKKPKAVQNDVLAGSAAKSEQQSGIKIAIARGPTVTIKKLDETGELQQGKCKRAVYEASTGQITMSDYPQVQRGNILQVATSAETTMVFNQAGKLITNGPSKTDILQGADASVDAGATFAPQSAGNPQQ